MIELEQLRMIVVAHHVEDCGLARALRLVLVDRLRDDPRGVELPHPLGELLALLDAVSVAAFGNLVADTPHDDARVIAGADHQAVDILFPRIVEEAGIIELALALLPAVESLVNDEDAQFVGRVERGLARRVVRVADGVVAGRLHQLHLAPVGIGKTCRSKHVVVVMDIAAAQQRRLAVNPHAVLGIERHRAKAETRPPLVNDNAVDADLLHERMQVRRVGRPEEGPG